MRKAALGVILATAWVVMLAAPTSAASPGFQISPSSGPVGTTIHASDSLGECDGNNAQVTVSLQGDSGPAVASTVIVPNSDGTWTADITVPADTEPGSFSVTARCDQDEGADSFDYVASAFTVTGAATTTTTATAAPSSTTTTTAAPVAVATEPVTAAPAVAVDATPAMTG